MKHVKDAEDLSRDSLESCDMLSLVWRARNVSLYIFLPFVLLCKHTMAMRAINM